MWPDRLRTGWLEHRLQTWGWVHYGKTGQRLCVEREVMESVKPAAASSDHVSHSHAPERVGRADPLIRWTIADGWGECIVGTDAPDWSDLAGDRRATLVKSNPNRRIWQVAVGDRVLYVKEFVGASIGAILRRLLRGGPEVGEWRAGKEAARRDVPCVRFVACGRAPGRGILVSEGMAEAVLLSDAWLQAQSAADAHPGRHSTDALTEAVASLLGRAHGLGFVHTDDHPRNILTVEKDDGRYAVYYVDVQNARTMAAVPDRLAVASLAQLHQWFQLRSSRPQRLRFLRTYCMARTNGNRHAAREMMRRFAPAVIAATHQQAAKLWAKRDRRIGRTNSYFARLRLDDGSRALVTLRFRQRDRFPSPSVPDQTMDQWKARLSPRGVGDDGLLDQARERRTEVRGIDRWVGWWFRGSPSHRVFVMGHRLRHRDIPCRWPLAEVDSLTPTRQAFRRAWLDTQPQTVDLATFVRQVGTDATKRRQVCRSLSRLVSLMADRGVSVPRPTGSTFGVVTALSRVIIDDSSDVVLRKRDVSRDRLATARGLHDLLRGAGAFRRTDGVRFLKTLTPRDWRRLWRTIEQLRAPAKGN